MRKKAAGRFSTCDSPFFFYCNESGCVMMQNNDAHKNYIIYLLKTFNTRLITYKNIRNGLFIPAERQAIY